MGNRNSISAQDTDLCLWYLAPAKSWNEALPVGNGSLGAMIYGKVETERIQINEETIWSKASEYKNKPETKRYIPEIRNLLFDGKYIEAEKLVEEKILTERMPSGTNCYQMLGDLILAFPDHKEVRNYRRYLDIEKAVSGVEYQIGESRYKREIFSSAVDKAIVIKLSGSGKNSLNFLVSLSRPEHAEISLNNSEINMTVYPGGKGKGVNGKVILKIRNSDGNISVSGNNLQVENTSEAEIIIIAASDYRGGDPSEICKQRMNHILSRTYQEILASHIKDYQLYFNRVSLDLGSSQAFLYPTDARLEAFRNGAKDPGLITLYYQFARYLLISCSRSGSLPSNLQGIWADGIITPWNDDYHININIQMCYWPVQITNLPELHKPFLDFIDQLRPPGRQTAREVYDCDGFVAHQTTDVWHFTTPTGKPRHGMWPMGAAWASRQYLEHYLFTGDKEYLASTGYPVMKEAAEFVMDYLVESPKTGKLVSGPSSSPENAFITETGEIGVIVMGPAMDQEIIWDLLSNCIKAAEILEADANFRKKMKKTLEHLEPVKIGSDGRILEWGEEMIEEHSGHRHISHLYALHPGYQFNWKDAPEYMVASKKTIDHRLWHGGGHTGWSRAWVINFYARLKDAEAAYENVEAIIIKSTLPNLFDNNPPFTIDGNFGACAGITEMLIQSHLGEIELLPALPTAWNTGSVKGICARGGFEIDMSWKDGKLINADITSKLGNPCTILYNGNQIDLHIKKGSIYKITSNNSGLCLLNIGSKLVL